MDDYTVALIKSVRDRVRKSELQRMHEWDPRYNIRSERAHRESHASTFTLLDQTCQVRSWAQLCRELPEAEDLLSHCQLDEELKRRLAAKCPGERQLWRALKDEKRATLVQMVAGYNMFVTGSAGVGKSKVVQAARLTLTAFNERIGHDLMVTGSTGTAAFNVSGRTLHSAIMLFGGQDPRILAAMRKRCETLDTLIIDEISMVGVRDFYRTHLRMSSARDRTHEAIASLPFGGVQIIAVGDFFQLADVSKKPTGIDRVKRAEESHLRDVTDFRLVAPELAQFDRYARAFATPLWWQTFGRVAVMSQIERQTDEQLIRFLQQIRCGCINQSDAAAFVREHTRPVASVPDTAMFLYATNDEASEHNSRKLAELPGPDINFCMLQCGRIIDEKTGERELRDGELPKHRRETTLRVGARVRTWANFDVERLGITNGTYAELVGLVPITRLFVSTGMGSTERPNGDPATAQVHARYQSCMFRRTASHQSIELVSGTGFSMDLDPQNLDGVALTLKQGQHSVYQTESRHPMWAAPDQSTVDRYHREEGARAGKFYKYEESPYNATRHFCTAVRFFHPGTDPDTVYVLSPVILTMSEQRRGHQLPVFSQVQMPLCPGFASTVHAAQGMTLDALAVSLSRDIDPALAYVALTRARSASSISLIGDIRLPYVRPDRAVAEFYRLLQHMGRCH